MRSYVSMRVGLKTGGRSEDARQSDIQIRAEEGGFRRRAGGIRASMGCLIALGMIGCSQEEDWQPASSIDEGAVCVYSEPESMLDYYGSGGTYPEQQFKDGEPLTIQYTGFFGDESCHRNYQLSCHVSAEGGQLVVHSEVTYEVLVNAEACTEMALILTATCTSDPLSEGDYTVAFGEASEALEIPSTRPAFCLEAQ